MTYDLKYLVNNGIVIVHTHRMGAGPNYLRYHQDGTWKLGHEDNFHDTLEAAKTAWIDNLHSLIADHEREVQRLEERINQISKITDVEVPPRPRAEDVDGTLERLFEVIDSELEPSGISDNRRTLLTDLRSHLEAKEAELRRPRSG